MRIKCRFDMEFAMASANEIVGASQKCSRRLENYVAKPQGQPGSGILWK